jgi:CheY-like chemotaxis protein
MTEVIVVLVLGVLVVAVIIFFVPALRDRIKKINMGPAGVSIEFFEKAVREKEQRSPDRRELSRKLARLPRQGQLLWVDDRPENNTSEIRALEGLGLRVSTARTNAEAEQLAAAGRFDAVISDIGRPPPEAASAGLELPRLLQTVGEPIPLVFYVGHADADRTADGYPVVDTPSALITTLAPLLATHRRSDVGER